MNWLFYILMTITPSLVVASVWFFVQKVKKSSSKNIFFYQLWSFFLFSNVATLLIIFILLRYSIDGLVALISKLPFWFVSFYLISNGIFSFLLAVYFLLSPFLKIDTTQKWSATKKQLISFSWVSGFCVIFFVSVNWYVLNVPQVDPSNFFYTLILPKEGTDPTLFVRGLIEIPLQSIILGCGLLIFFAPFYQLIFLKRGKSILLVLSLLFLVGSFLNALYALKLPSYLRYTSENLSKPVFSHFFDEYYIDPKKATIKFPSQPQNLILIFMESMESSFTSRDEGGIFLKNRIPKLSQLAKEHINFSHTDGLGGGVDLVGTGWTAAAIAAKTSGLPLILPLNENPAKTKRFLNGATTLTDLLNQEGYTQLFLFGSKKSYGCRDLYLEKHGNLDIHDIDWYKAHKYLENDYHCFWGFEDLKLYRFAKDELLQLSKSNKPFFFGMLTVDTHFPEGYRCDLCPPIDEDGSSQNLKTRAQYQSVVSCADRQLDDFISWCKIQPWYENTTIVVVGDHLFMDSEAINIIGNQMTKINKSENRRWINIIINSKIKALPEQEKYREFSSLDMFPTILEAMGVTIEERALAFGRSLFAPQKTLIEEFGFDYVNEQLLLRSIQYDEILFAQ